MVWSRRTARLAISGPLRSVQQSQPRVSSRSLNAVDCGAHSCPAGAIARPLRTRPAACGPREPRCRGVVGLVRASLDRGPKTSAEQLGALALPRPAPVGRAQSSAPQPRPTHRSPATSTSLRAPGLCVERECLTGRVVSTMLRFRPDAFFGGGTLCNLISLSTATQSTRSRAPLSVAQLAVLCDQPRRASVRSSNSRR